MSRVVRCAACGRPIRRVHPYVATANVATGFEFRYHAHRTLYRGEGG